MYYYTNDSKQMIKNNIDKMHDDRSIRVVYQLRSEIGFRQTSGSIDCKIREKCNSGD